MTFCIGCGKESGAIDDSMPSSYKDFEKLGYTIYDARGESMGLEVFPGIKTNFSSVIVNEKNKSIIALTEDNTYLFCKNMNNENWSMIRAYNPAYSENEYKTFRDGSQISATAMKNAYIMAQVMNSNPENPMKYVLPDKLAAAISDDEIEVGIDLMTYTETGEFPKDISEGMWMITLYGKETGNSLSIIPGKANSDINACTIDNMFDTITITKNPEIRELYANIYTEMEKEGSSFDTETMKASLGDDTMDAIIKILKYVNK